MGLFRVECPHCGSLRVNKWSSKYYGKQRYRCKDCRRTFFALKDYAPITKSRSRWFL